jgi:N6-L-threonylcarbamoyladenine synthase
MIIIGVESSCDDTSIAILKDGVVLSNVVSSQYELAKKYGGIMPEEASRAHLEVVTIVLDEALKKANLSINQIDGVAVTVGPGLMGSLHIGLQVAKAIALITGKPLIPVNHLAGHIYSIALEHEIQYPAMVLLVSGGNTILIRLLSELTYNVLGQTQDDAIGEVFDKVSRLLNLGYPGGPIIESKAKDGQNIYQLPFPKDDDSLDFSFSGLKTAVFNLLNKQKKDSEPYRVEDVCASFQYAAIGIIAKKVKSALLKYPSNQLLVVGGVAANQYLIKQLKEHIPDNIPLLSPSLKYCGDNAAMIAYTGGLLLRKKVSAKMTLGINPNLKLESVDTTKMLQTPSQKRLLSYVNILKKMADAGKEEFCSADIAKEIAVIESSTVRRDLRTLDVHGTKGYGHNVKKVLSKLQQELGISENLELLLVGVGNMGKALIRYNQAQGHIGNIIYAFDLYPFASKFNDVPIYKMSEIEEKLKPSTQVALLSVPPDQADSVAKKLLSLGIKIIINFSGKSLAYPDKNIVVINFELASLIQEGMHKLRPFECD